MQPGDSSLKINTLSQGPVAANRITHSTNSTTQKKTPIPRNPQFLETRKFPKPIIISLPLQNLYIPKSNHHCFVDLACMYRL